ncbi:hypothetical protein [Vibrio cincinnatiensis]|uniref:hypothetical protein n=1 Tax=Vibrio cincinnatiensis TaxID=675 RepID=UPI0013025469|nr:hypothetical protein [Vibrio cincinnatiensis]
MRILIIFSLFFSSFSYAQVTANLSGKTLDDFFMVASTVFEKTIIVDPLIDSNVKVFQVKNAVNFRDVFFGVIRAHNLAYIETNNVIRVYSKNKMKSGDIITTRTYKLNNISGKDISESITKSLQIQSSLFEVQGVTNVDSILADTVLMITAPTSMLDNIFELLHVIDVPQPQIKISAIILEHTLRDSSEKTVDFKAGSGALSAGFNGSILNATSVLSNFVSNSNDFNALIKWIDQTGTTQILSQPSFTIANGKTGLISVGQELPFVTGQYTTDGDGSQKPFQTIERRDVGLLLKVQPRIGSNGNITLEIHQELSSVDKSIQASDIVTNKRLITTTLNTKYGQTIALAGMTSKDIQKMNSKVPFLGDIPVLSLLFTSESETETHKTLSVLIKIDKV